MFWHVPCLQLLPCQAKSAAAAVAAFLDRKVLPSIDTAAADGDTPSLVFPELLLLVAVVVPP